MTDVTTNDADAIPAPVRDFITTTLAENPIVVFMKGSPDEPRCGFSAVTVQILDHLGANFVGVDVLQNDDLRQGIKTFSDWPTIPQLYVQGEFIGGSDIVRQMYQDGELKTLLADKGLLGA
jgi:monothiol glutaredoxin